jgi:hypothetical protein
MKLDLTREELDLLIGALNNYCMYLSDTRNKIGGYEATNAVTDLYSQSVTLSHKVFNAKLGLDQDAVAPAVNNIVG